MSLKDTSISTSLSLLNLSVRTEPNTKRLFTLWERHNAEMLSIFESIMFILQKLFVVPFHGKNHYMIAMNLIHYAVSLVDMTRPYTRKFMFQLFWFPNTSSRMLRNVVKKTGDFAHNGFLPTLSPKITVFQCRFGIPYFHKSSVLMVLYLPSRASFWLRFIIATYSGLYGFSSLAMSLRFAPYFSSNAMRSCISLFLPSYSSVIVAIYFPSSLFCCKFT